MADVDRVTVSELGRLRTRQQSPGDWGELARSHLQLLLVAGVAGAIGYVPEEPSREGRISLTVLVLAIAGWTLTRVGDAIALAGTIGKGYASNFDHGIDAFASIVKRPCTLEEAIGKAFKLKARAAEDAVRMVKVGLFLGGARHRGLESGFPAGMSRGSIMVLPACARTAQLELNFLSRFCQFWLGVQSARPFFSFSGARCT